MPDVQQTYPPTLIPAQNLDMKATLRSPQSIPPYHFCTYFDRNYLTRGLALYESLVRQCQRPFTLWILCFDDETYATLARLDLTHIRLISEQEFAAGDEDLLNAKSKRSRVEYYWTCTPSLPLYVLKQAPEIEVITYLDADLYFFSDPQPIYDEFGDGSILIIEHRYAPEHVYLAANSGIYNVGVMAFRRDQNGLACLAWWRERCLEWCHAYHEDGKFGDQKYLESWPERFAGVIVLQHEGAGLAPWNLTNYKFTFGRHGIQVDGKPLVFFHFHGFKVVRPNLIEPLPQPYTLSSGQAAAVFLPYAQALRRAAALVERSHVDEFIPSLSAGELRQGVLCHRYLLVQPTWLSRMLWQLGIGYCFYLWCKKSLVKFIHLP